MAALFAVGAVRGRALKAVQLVELPRAVGVGIQVRSRRSARGQVRDRGIEQNRANAQAVDIAIHGKQRDLVVMRQRAALEQAVVGPNGGAHKREILGTGIGLQLTHLRQQCAFGIHPMLLNGGAAALPRTCECNAARLAVDYGDLRKRRGRKAIGKIARGLKAVVLFVIRIVMPKLLQDQRDGVEVFGIKRSVENPRDHSASFYCGCISSTVLPCHWHLIMVPLCSINSPCLVALLQPPLASFFCTCARYGVHRCARCATLNQYFQCRCASAADRRITDSQSTAAYQTGGLHGI